MPRKELKELVVRLALMHLLLHHALVATVARHDHFHLIFQKQLHFFQGNFEREVFYVPVALLYELFKLAFTAGVFFGESSEFLIIFQQRLPDIVRRNRHPFPPGWK
jgi:hypothetical protein